MPVTVISASRGKYVRAEPVSALYEKGLVRHAKRFPEIDEQLVNFTSAGYTGEKSPDRADALVWAVTSLMVEQLAGWGILEFYRLQAAGVSKPSVSHSSVTTQSSAGQVGTGVRLKAPAGISTAYGLTGHAYNVDNDGFITVHADDVIPLKSAGFVEPIAETADEGM